MEKSKFDEFDVHEALDRTFLVMQTFDAFVFKHPFVYQNVELQQMAWKIEEAMADFYQHLGKIHFSGKDDVKS